MAWFEPQLCQDAIKANTRNEGERLYARRKRAKNLIEKLVRPHSPGNPGEHFIEVSRGRRILIRHRPPPPANSGLIIAPASSCRALTGPNRAHSPIGRVLPAVQVTWLERALGEEMTGHLGYDKHDPADRGSGNSRNGTTGKTVLTDAGGRTWRRQNPLRHAGALALRPRRRQRRVYLAVSSPQQRSEHRPYPRHKGRAWAAYLSSHAVSRTLGHAADGALEAAR